MYFAISDSMFARTCESLRWLAQMPAPFKRSSLNFERFIAAQERLHEIASARCLRQHADAEMLHFGVASDAFDLRSNALSLYRERNTRRVYGASKWGRVGMLLFEPKSGSPALVAGETHAA